MKDITSIIKSLGPWAIAAYAITGVIGIYAVYKIAKMITDTASMRMSERQQQVLPQETIKSMTTTEVLPTAPYGLPNNLVGVFGPDDGVF